MGVGAVAEEIEDRVAAVEAQLVEMNEKLDRIIALALPGLEEPDRDAGSSSRSQPRAG